MSVRSLVAVLLCMVTLFNFGVLGAQVDSRELTIANIPACGLRCLFEELPKSGCAATDFDCVCGSNDLSHGLAACMLANCTMQVMLDTSRVQADICHLSEESKTHEVVLYTIVAYSIAFLSVILRITGKLVSNRLSWDDAVVIVSLLMTVVPLGCILDMAKKGFGRHLWNLEDNALSPILRSLYISWSMYVVILFLIKVSLVLFYLKIFETRKFRITAYIFLVFLTVNSIGLILMTVFTCIPIYSFWNRDMKTGKCIDMQAGAYAISASSVVQDLILLIIPIVFIRNLQMKRYRKFAVGCMFVVGTFGCVATLMRLPSLSTFKISIDPCWDYVPVTIWSELELAAGFLCVSLPSIRVIIVKILPKSVKKFLTHATTSSRSRSRSNTAARAQPSLQPEQGKQANVWVGSTPSPIAVKIHAEPSVRGSFLSAFWNRDRASRQSPAQLSQLRSGSRRLESPADNYCDVGVAISKPVFRDVVVTEDKFEQVEMMSVPPKAKAHRHVRESCGSCRGEHITALPGIGCIPEGSWSGTSLVSKDRWREKEGV